MKEKTLIQKHLGLKDKSFIKLLLISIIFYLYIGDLFFYGNNSLKVLNKLKEDSKEIDKQIEIFGKKNILLQKEYFDLIELGSK